MASAIIRRATCVAVALGLVLVAVPANAQSQGGITLSATAGFDGYFKEGRWIPVRVGMANDGPDAEVLLEVLPRSAVAGSRSEYSR